MAKTQGTQVSTIKPEDLAIVGRSPLFAGLDAAALMSLLAEAVVINYTEDTLLFQRGDEADRFYAVVSGVVKLIALEASGRQSVIALMRPGTTFAEAAMLGIGRFPLVGEASAGSRLVQIMRGPFLRHLEGSPDLNLRMLDGIANWERQLIRELSEIKMRSPAQRLASILLAEVPSGETKSVVRLPVNKFVVASRIGITPESLSRAIARLRDLGVTTSGQSIQISDVAELRRFAEPERKGSSRR